MPLEAKEQAKDFALRCNSVSKVYDLNNKFNFISLFIAEKNNNVDSFHALKNISMEVPRGKVVGILGRNGAGKSTLLRVLGGVYEPTTGVVELSGSMVGLFELGGIGNPYLTGIDYAVRYLSIMGASKRQIPDLLKDIIEFSELGDAFTQAVRTYSSGMQARLFFATATAMQHDIYLIDELLSVGDEHFQVKCWKRMRQRLLCGASGVLVTHDWTAIVKLCECANVIQNGVISYSGPSDKVVASYLNLPLPSGHIAAFAPINAPVYTVLSRQDASIEIFVDIFESVDVILSVSIEHLRIGSGWEIIVINDGFFIGSSPGRYRVKISAGSLPLMPGTYSLNLFLTQVNGSGNTQNIALDCRSWTYGNGLTLIVDGSHETSCVSLPYIARKTVED